MAKALSLAILLVALCLPIMAAEAAKTRTAESDMGQSDGSFVVARFISILGAHSRTGKAVFEQSDSLLLVCYNALKLPPPT